ISIPSVVTSIGNNAFSNCSGLTSISIPSGVTSIGNNAFYDCSGLTSIVVNENNNNYCDIDGVLYSKDKKTLLGYPSGKENSSFYLPNTVYVIGVNSFRGANNLINFDLTSNIRKIDNSAFTSCRGLTSVNIPSSVISIGNNAFYNCTNLTNITIRKAVDSISGSPWGAPNATVTWNP
ncbi:MAG: leucine-rich repeat domain-containing protein, partial [Clostridia bacterium]|nr:leucine-rich repeat domain-containing protein [Clostridia bacterium]